MNPLRAQSSPERFPKGVRWSPRRIEVTSAVFLTLAAWTLLAAWPCLSLGRARAATPQSAEEISPQAARALEEKFREFTDPNAQSPPSFQPIVITEVEANSYLKYRGSEFLPAGVHDPEIHIHADNVSGAAEVDFDKLNQTTRKDDVATGVLTWLFRGKQKVSATGKLQTENGQGKVTFENVVLGQTTIPAWLVSWLLETYVQQRYHVDLTKPFALPHHVTDIELADGRATFHRSTDKAMKSH